MGMMTMITIQLYLVLLGLSIPDWRRLVQVVWAGPWGSFVSDRAVDYGYFIGTFVAVMMGRRDEGERSVDRLGIR